MNKKLWILVLVCGAAIVGSLFNYSIPNKHINSSDVSAERSYNILQRQSANYAAVKESSLSSSLHAMQRSDNMSFAYHTGNGNVATTAGERDAHNASGIIVIHDSNVNYSDTMVGSTTTESTFVLYISDNKANQIFSCRLRLDGGFNCKVSLSGLYGPEGLVVIQNNLYIANMNNYSITVCNLSKNGNITACNATSVPAHNPVNMFYSNQQLFIKGSIQDGVAFINQTAACGIDANGKILSCALVNNVPQTAFSSITFNGYTYSANYTNNAINRCTDIYSSACNLITDPTIISPTVFTIFNGYAYIGTCISSPNFDQCLSHSVVQCKILTNGSYSACQIVTNAVQWPGGIAGYNVSPQ